MDKIFKALQFATIKHQNQFRKQPRVPYIIHPITVAKILVDSGIEDKDIICGALLHDTVEDTDTTLEEIEKEFGHNVMTIVKEVTDDKEKSKAERKLLQIEHAKHASFGARAVKYGDKIANINDIFRDSPWDEEYSHGYICWSYFVLKNAGEINEKLTESTNQLWKRANLQIDKPELLQQELDNFIKRIERESR